MITKLTHHDNCDVYVQLERWNQRNHYASLHCKKHSVWIQWLNKWDVQSLKDLGIEVRPRKPIDLKEMGL